MDNISSFDGKKRCFGNKENQQLLALYHDTEWGIPLYADDMLLEMLILEGAQAGLSWEIVLKKRSGYRQLFHNFQISKVAAMTDAQLDQLCANPLIIRNRLKIFAARQNAISCIRVIKEFGSFAKYLWNFVDNKPIYNQFHSWQDVPVSTALSVTLSKDLKKRGFKFVGPTIVYSFMQAIGMVNDHLTDCWCYGLNLKRSN